MTDWSSQHAMNRKNCTAAEAGHPAFLGRGCFLPHRLPPTSPPPPAYWLSFPTTVEPGSEAQYESFATVYVLFCRTGMALNQPDVRAAMAARLSQLGSPLTGACTACSMCGHLPMVPAAEGLFWRAASRPARSTQQPQIGLAAAMPLQAGCCTFGHCTPPAVL